MLASMLASMIRGAFLGESARMEMGWLLRGTIILCVVVNFGELTDTITAAIAGVKNLIPQPGTILNDLNEFSNMSVSLQKKVADPTLSTTDKMLEYIKGAFDFDFGMKYFLQSLAMEGFSMVVRVGIEKIRALLLAFLTIAGPLSITISVFPGMEKVAGHWFRGWFSIHMWSVTICILDAIIHNYNKSVFASADSYANQMVMMDAMIINLVCIIMYLMVPTLTSYFVGQALTNGFLSRASSIAKTVASAAVTAASMGAGMFAGAGAAGSSAASAGNTGALNLGSMGTPPMGGGGGSPALASGASMRQLGSGNAGLLGGGSSPAPLPPSGGLGPITGSGSNAIPIRQLPVPAPQRPSPNYSHIPYSDYEPA